MHIHQQQRKSNGDSIKNSIWIVEWIVHSRSICRINNLTKRIVNGIAPHTRTHTRTFVDYEWRNNVKCAAQRIHQPNVVCGQIRFLVLWANNSVLLMLSSAYPTRVHHAGTNPKQNQENQKNWICEGEEKSRALWAQIGIICVCIACFEHWPWQQQPPPEWWLHMEQLEEKHTTNRQKLTCFFLSQLIRFVAATQFML